MCRGGKFAICVTTLDTICLAPLNRGPVYERAIRYEILLNPVLRTLATMRILQLELQTREAVESGGPSAPCARARGEGRGAAPLWHAHMAV